MKPNCLLRCADVAGRAGLEASAGSASSSSSLAANVRVGDGALVARVAAGHDGSGRLSATDDGGYTGCLRVNEVARLQVCDRGPTI
jgi:hypothetical protein